MGHNWLSYFGEDICRVDYAQRHASLRPVYNHYLDMSGDWHELGHASNLNLDLI